jgi:hypothetical protein
MIIEDSKGKRKRIQVNKTEPYIKSVPVWAAKAPDGVDPARMGKGKTTEIYVDRKPI